MALTALVSVADYMTRYPGDDELATEEQIELLLLDATALVLGYMPGYVEGADEVRDRAAQAAVRQSVHRALQGPDGMAGLASVQQVAGVYSMSVRPANSFGEIYLTQQERDSLMSGGGVTFVGGGGVAPWV